MAETIERDDVTGTAFKGHEWDGIKELDTPTPRWWLYTLYGTIVWAIGYMIYYPALPLVATSTKGLSGYSSRAAVEADIGQAMQAQAQWLDKIAAASLEEIVKDADLLQFARAGGAAAFKVNCVQCHGAGATGSAGYPNLNDDDWLWGGSLEQIHDTVRNGVRFALNPDTRESQMLAFGIDGILERTQIADAANYTLTLSGAEADAAAAARGQLVFADNCAACHGDKGEGNRELGAPNLTDQISLYGGELKSVVAQIERPRHGVMPAWSHRLDATTVKQLAVFVHSLGGGEQPAAP